MEKTQQTYAYQCIECPKCKQTIPFSEGTSFDGFKWRVPTRLYDAIVLGCPHCSTESRIDVGNVSEKSYSQPIEADQLLAAKSWMRFETFEPNQN